MNYKPFGTSVGTTSRMILPPLSGVPVSQRTWAGDTIYDSGSIIEVDGIYYWSPEGGTSGPGQLFIPHPDGMEDGDINWYPVNRQRKRAYFRNLATTTNIVFLSFGHEAVMNMGVAIDAGDVYETYEEDTLACGVYAITAVWPVYLAIQEF